MSVYKIRYGTPEEFVPTKFAPTPKTKILTTPTEFEKSLNFKVTRRGLIITFPIDSTTEIYGFGLQLKGFQHKGRKKMIRPNADPKSPSGDSHAPVPFFVTNAGFGLFVDTARYATFYCGKQLKPTAMPVNTDDENKLAYDFDDIYAVKETKNKTIMTIEIPYAEGVDLYYFTGDSILDIVCEYNMFSGGGCMPPMWGLGHFYRTDLKFNEEQVLKMASDIREMDLPCDVLGLEPGWQSQTYSCSFKWDPTRFKNAKETVKKLTDMGFKLNLWEHSFTHPTSDLYQSLMDCSGDYLVWNGLVPDFATEKATKIFKDLHTDLINMGVKGVKLDECDGSDFTGGWTFPNCASFPSGMDGEQYHSLFGTLYTKAVYSAFGENNTLSQVRNLGALCSSYPFVLYSDLYGQDDFLTGVVNSGFSGLLWSPEIRHASCKEELIRRMQMNIFSVQTLVNAFYLPEMPWVPLECTDEIRALLNTRMSLIPYLYNAFYDYYTTGKPPVRALVCDYEKEENALSCATEYLFGDNIIVAPIAFPEKERDVWLPDGEWYNFFTGERYEGGTHHVVTDNIPVFVKGGTLLPLATPVNHVDDDTVFEITLTAYGDVTFSTATLVEKDGNDYKIITVDQFTTDIDSKKYKIV